MAVHKWYRLGDSTRCAVLSRWPKYGSLLFTGRNKVQVGLAYTMGSEHICAITLISAQDARSWYRRKPKEEEVVEAGYIFLRSVEYQGWLCRGLSASMMARSPSRDFSWMRMEIEDAWPRA